MVKDPFSSVRIRAIKTLMACLAAVSVVPLSDANIFPEYILPNVLPLCHDKNELVRAAMAKHLAEVRCNIILKQSGA
jgi:phosphoinositide-3-kinase regulatory subunit 4